MAKRGVMWFFFTSFLNLMFYSLSTITKQIFISKRCDLFSFRKFAEQVLENALEDKTAWD